MGMGMLGALGGLGEAGVGIGKQMMAAALREDELKFLETAKLRTAEAEMKMKKGYADQERTDSVARVATAKDGLLNSAINQKFSGSDAAVAEAQARPDEGGRMTAEQLAVIAQAKDAERAKIAADPRMDMQAARASGDMSAKEYGTFMLGERRADQQAAAAAKKAEYDAANLELKERGLDIKDKQVMAMIARVGSSGGGGGSDKTSAFIQQFDKIKKEMPSWSSDQILTYMNQAKTPGESYSRTEEKDPTTGDTKVKTTRKGSGPAPSASSGADTESSKPLMPWERHRQAK